MTTKELTSKAIAQVDAAGQMQDVLNMPDQLRDAVWRTESAQLEPIEAPAGLLVCGMGGSAVGGDLAAAAMGDSLSRPLRVVRGYGLPAWATEKFVVLCLSYSGDTEETLACFEAAGALGAPRVVATTGGKLAERARSENVPVIGMPAGLVPRAAVAYLFAAAAEVVALTEAAPGIRAEIDTTASHLEELTKEWGPDGDPESLPKNLAGLVMQATPTIFGANITTFVARRWKTQLNENAKVPAAWAELPEADHNEIEAWEQAAGAGERVAIFLQDADQHPRVRRRIELTEKLVSPGAADTVRITSRGDTPTERLFSLVLLGDLFSLYLAVLRGVDPTPLPAVEDLKKELKKGD